MSDPTKATKDPLVDRLAAEEGPDRAHYALGTLLDAQDFLDEQLYHRGRLARALAYLFGAGTAAGLKVGFHGGPRGTPSDPEQDEIFVEPGLALDAFGRLIELPRRACIRLKRWVDYHRHPDRVAVLRAAVRGDAAVTWLFVRFLPCERGKTPVFAQGPFDATNAVAPSRVRDGYELRLFLEGASDLPPFARDAADPLTPATRPPLAGAPGSAQRVEELEDLILEGWGRPADLRDEPGWVLLGRVDVPVHVTADDVTYGVDDLPDDEPPLHNHLRPFVYGAWALAHEGGLPLPARSAGSP
jgi:hypothetical protein